jgi:3-oxoacyl-[acyl-carrier protein] reductase
MNIVITGASRGIGAAVTKAFSVSGDHKIFVLSRNRKKLDELVAFCQDLNPNARVFPIVTELTLLSELEKSVNEILSVTSSVDILINNAGLAIRKPFEDFDSEDADLMMNVNFQAPANIIRLLLPALIKAGNSHVVNISSMAGFQGSTKFSGLSYYSASKAAIAVLTEALSAEYKGKGVTFNCLALGAVQTEMFSEVFPGYKAPLDPTEIATYIADFALNAHNYLKGKIIPVSLSEP